MQIEAQRKEQLKNELEQWKKDLRRMSKIYRSIKPEDSAAEVKKFREAKQLFNRFQKRWEEWVYRKLLPKKDKEERSWLHDSVVKDAWRASTVLMGLFPDKWVPGTNDKFVPDPWRLSQDRDKYVRKYNKAWKSAVDSIEEYIENEASDDPKDTPSVEQVAVGPVTVFVKNWGKEDWNEKALKKFMQEIKGHIKKIQDAGFGIALKGLPVTIDFRDDARGGADYEPWSPDGKINMYSWGLEDGEHSFIHEVGHRFYYRNMKESARNEWDNAIKGQVVEVTPEDVDNFMNKYLPSGRDNKVRVTKTQIRERLRKEENDKATYTKYFQLSKSIPAYTHDREEIRDHFLRYNVGEKVHVEYITEYATEKPSEAYAEAFSLYVGEGPGRLGQWTRELFKRVSESGGVRVQAILREVQAALKLLRTLSTSNPRRHPHRQRPGYPATNRRRP